MDLQQEWQLLQEKQFSAPVLPEADIRLAIRQDSQGPIAALQKALRWRLFFVILFLLFGILLTIYSWYNPELRLLMAIFDAYYLIGLVLSIRQLRLLQRSASLDNNLRLTLTTYYRVIKNAIRTDEIVGLFMYPLALVLGFLYANVEAGDTLAQVLTNPRNWMILVVMILVFSPIFHIFVRWANRKAFSKYLIQLKQNIDLLQ
jgi:hypothetical protein